MSNSVVFSPHSPSTFPSSKLAFFAFTVVAATTLPRTATASPVPVQTKRLPQFLDFLYPTWYTNQRDTQQGLSGASSSSTRRLKPFWSSSTTPSSSRPAAVEAAPGVRGTFDTDYSLQPKVPLSQPQSQQRQRRRQRRSISPTPQPPLAKRVTISGNTVPVKYESQDTAGGWVIANSWDLHGHHRRGDTTTNPIPSDSLPVQNLDTTNPSLNYPNISVNTTTDRLDLPFGWDSGGPNQRHESYDPVVVAVFAVILVLSILTTIGLCRWRAKKLKRLRDLERLEREKEGNDAHSAYTTDDGSSIEGKKRKSSGSSSAIRKRFARFRRRHRARRSVASQAKTSDVEEPTGNDPTDDNRPEESSATSIISSTAPSRSSISHRSHLSTSPTVDLSPSNVSASATDHDFPIDGMENEASIGGDTEQDTGRPRGHGRGPPRITITGSEVTPTTTPTQIATPTTMPTTIIIALDPTIDSTLGAEPPAYPAETSPSPNHNPTTNTNAGNTSTERTRRTRTGAAGARTPLGTSPLPEKAPIPGLEAEYDERDIASYSTNPANSYLGVGSLSPDLFNSRLSSSNPGLFNSSLSTSGTGLAGLSVRGSAPPTRRPSRVRFVDNADGVDGGTVDAENTRDETEEEQVPSFEPFASTPGTSLGALGALAGASRVAGGAVLRAHVATDDKGLLERLRELRGEPSLELAGISGSEPPPPPTHSSEVGSSNDSADLALNPSLHGTLAVGDAGLVIPAPAAPSFNEVEQWEFERQMALANESESLASLTTFTTPSSAGPEASSATAGASGSSSCRRIAASNNGFPALPAPPLPASSLAGGVAGDVGYGLGTVWNSLNVGVGVPSALLESRTNGNGSGKARVPNAPSLGSSSFRPSAPPPMSDEDTGAGGEVMPSAPPDWEVNESIPPASQEGNAHEGDQNPTADLSNADPTPDNEGDPDGNVSDGDGAESIVSTPPDGEGANLRWSATFRTRPEDGAGLPRYEP